VIEDAMRDTSWTDSAAFWQLWIFALVFTLAALLLQFRE
jgi:hypothetical protein